RMARTAGHRKLRDHAKHVPRSYRTQRQVPEYGIGYFPHAGSMAPQAILILIDRWSYGRDSVRRAYPHNTVLGSSRHWRHGKRRHLARRMSIVAIGACGMAGVVHHVALRRVVH